MHSTCEMSVLTSVDCSQRHDKLKHVGHTNSKSFPICVRVLLSHGLFLKSIFPDQMNKMKCPVCSRRTGWARTRCPACRTKLIQWYIIAVIAFLGACYGALLIMDLFSKYMR